MNFGLLLETFLATTWKRLLCLLALGLLILGLVSFYQSGLDLAGAKAEIQSREALIKAQDRTLAQIEQRLKARAEETAQAKKELLALKRRPATVQEIVREIPRFVSMPGTPAFKPFDFSVPRVSDEPMARSTDDSILFDSAQAQALRTFYLGCAEQKIDLTACQGDLADMKAKGEAERLRADLFRDQRDAAVRGMKGGSGWQRFTRNAKMVGLGIVLGVAGGIALTR